MRNLYIQYKFMDCILKNYQFEELESFKQELQTLHQESSYEEVQKKKNKYTGQFRENRDQNIPYLLIILILLIIICISIPYFQSYYFSLQLQQQRKLQKRQVMHNRNGKLDITNDELNSQQYFAPNTNDAQQKSQKDTFTQQGKEQDFEQFLIVADGKSQQQQEILQNEESFEEFPNSKIQIQVGQDYYFNIPNKLWVYQGDSKTYLEQLYLKNNKYYASISYYKCIFVNHKNFITFLSKKTIKKIRLLINILNTQQKISSQSNLKYYKHDILQEFILLNILKENGGIIINGKFAITENLSWINNILQNKYVNRANRGIRPQVIGFYSPFYTLPKVKQNIKPFVGIEQVDKYVSIFPAMENYFLAAKRDVQFINELIKTIEELLRNPFEFKRQKNNYILNKLNGQDMYAQYFLLATQIILQNKQKQIDLSPPIDNYRHFAIDYYGLNLINSYYGPYKLQSIWKNKNPEKIFYNLAQYTSQEFISNIGPLKYIAKLTPQRKINKYLEEIRKDKKQSILNGSYIQKLFYLNSNFSFIFPQKQQNFTKTKSEQWSIPKIVWIFWDKGLRKSQINNQICVQNLRRMAKQSDFRLNEVNDSNTNDYLDNETIIKIQQSLKNAKLHTYQQSRGDLYRLALLLKYGGVYMDASYIALQNLDWLIDIGMYPSEYIFNRYGNLPKVFMIWHPHFGSPHSWSINQKYSTKNQWQLSYQNNFIAAEQDNELIRDWFNLLIQLYSKSYEEVEQIYKKYNIYQHRWISNSYHYLVAMDAIKCIIGKKQKELQAQNSSWQNANDYYRIWSMSGYLGQQKFRFNFNFQNMGEQDNYFIYRYPQDYVEGIIGKVRHIFKFYSKHNSEISNFIAKHSDNNFQGEVHSQSIFMKYMWMNTFKIQQTDSGPKLKLS